MTPEQVFSLVNLIATAAWIALMIFPGRHWVAGIVTSTVVPLLFAIVYVGIVATTFGRTPGGFSTLAGVATLFSNPWALLAMPAFASGLAFIGHRFFQKNKPGVVDYPVWGTIGNWVMTKDVLFGKLKW